MNYIRDINLKENNGWNVIVEIPKGTNSKFELEDGTFDKIVEVRKVIGKYPFCYGCFPRTHAGDNDPLDMILISKKKHKSLDIVNVQAIAVIKTIDNGEVDDKIICIPSNETFKRIDKRYKSVLKFLSKYKGKNSNTQIDYNIYDCNDAVELILKANAAYNNKIIGKSKLTSF